MNAPRSALVWTLLFSFACISIALFIPHRALNAADGVTSTFRVLVTKLAEFLPSKEQADIVVLGSSLVLTPAVRCDDRMLGKAPCYDRWYYDRYIPEYTKSDYLHKRLLEKTGLDLKIKNLGVASSIMSDQFGIMQLMLAEGKQPKLIIVGLAPRDFLDNSQQKHLNTPTRMFIREYVEQSILPKNLTATELQDSAEKMRRRFDKVIAALRKTSTNIACKLSGHEPRAEYGSVNTYLGDRPNRLKDLDTYKKLYNPPNFAMLQTQAKYLEDMLMTAKENKIAVLIVNMPLTRENTAALDPHALAAYTATLEKLTCQYGAGFLNIGSQNAAYSLNDFEDCCHLNSKGGEKFYAALIETISGDRNISASLNSNPSKNRIAGNHPSKAL